MSEKKEETNVQEIDVNLDELLGISADTVLIPEEKTPNILSPLSPDTTFIEDVKKAKETTDPETDPDPDPEANPNDAFLEDDKDDKPKGGRPTILVSATKNLIKKGLLQPFDDDKKIEDYTQEDFEELLEANMTQQKDALNDQLPKQFMEQLPPEMQQAYDYIANGGTDMKGMFQALAQSTETREIDISNITGQKQAIRAYLQATQWGTPDEIEEEVFSLEDSGNLEKKASQFKPKLDNMQQQMVNQKLTKQQY